MTTFPSVGRRLGEQTLSRRLDALAELIRIGRDRQGQADDPAQAQAQGQGEEPVAGFGPTLLDNADAVLKRAGERLRLSSSHTVIALAGGTGSGKSTLFNALSGATFSPPGVTRPTTRHVHACVWGMQGAAPLLDWLNVQRRHRYARASVLDSGESDLDGLLLLDLPDHDSVVTASMAAVDRLAKLADMVIWVLDPQKYADAAVHNRYLIPLAGHASVFTVVLNQIDTLPPEQIRDCEQDLRRLLDAEGLSDTPVLPVSARTGEGLGDLRALLTQTVQRNRAVTDRIAADIDGVIGGFEPHAGPRIAPDTAAPEPALAGSAGPSLDGPLAAPTDAGDQPQDRPPWELGDEEQPTEPAQPAPGRPPWEDATPDGTRRDVVDLSANVPPAPAGQLAEAFTGAAGLAAVAQAMASARGAQAARLTGWPAERLLRRRSAVPALRAAGGGPASRAAEVVGQAQQSEVDNAITAFADSVGGALPVPWAGSLREAARGAGRRGARRGRGRQPQAAGLVADRHAVAVAADRAGGGGRGAGGGHRGQPRDRPPPGAADRGVAHPVAARAGGGAAGARLPDRRRLQEHDRRGGRTGAGNGRNGDARPGRGRHPRPRAGAHRPRDRPVRTFPGRAGRRLGCVIPEPGSPLVRPVRHRLRRGRRPVERGRHRRRWFLSAASAVTTAARSP
jgi:GTP-binding protein EngB required for normal cell division